MAREHLGKTSLLALCFMACSSSIDYSKADPKADARAALRNLDFHLLYIRVGDSVVMPIDSAYANTSINVSADDPIRYVKVVADAGAPGVPGQAQLRYVRTFNTEMFRLLEENARPPRRAQ